MELSIQVGLFPDKKKQEILSLISFENDFKEVVQKSDFIIESTSEKLNLKKKIFADMDSIAPPDVILASETSGLLLSEIVEGTVNPERCIVTHSYTPPFLIPVVEVVPGEKTSNATLSKTIEILKGVGKTPVVCKETIGHIGVRLTTALRREAFHIIEDSPSNTSQIRTRSTTKQLNHCLENQKGGYYLRYTKTGKRSCRIITDSSQDD